MPSTAKSVTRKLKDQKDEEEKKHMRKNEKAQGNKRKQCARKRKSGRR